MTTLAKSPEVRPGIVETRVPSPVVGARLLVARLLAEAARQVAFSEAKVLFREAACTVERLEADLARVTAELERVRVEGRAG